MPSTRNRRRACAPDTYGCNFFFLIAKRCLLQICQGNGIENCDPTPKIFGSHPNHMPRLGRSAFLTILPPTPERMHGQLSND